MSTTTEISTSVFTKSHNAIIDDAIARAVAILADAKNQPGYAMDYRASEEYQPTEEFKVKNGNFSVTVRIVRSNF